MSDLNVVQLYESNIRDPAATLRKIADAIETGEYGVVGCGALVLMGDTLEVFGFGPDSEAPSCATVLYAGFQTLINAVVKHAQD